MITQEQEDRISKLRESYEKLQSLTCNVDPITQIIEESLQKKNIYKLKREAERAEAVAEAMVHIDYLAKRINELFSKYGVTFFKSEKAITVRPPNHWSSFGYNIEAKYKNGHAPFIGLEYKIIRTQMTERVGKDSINYDAILTEAANYIAALIPANV